MNDLMVQNSANLALKEESFSPEHIQLIKDMYKASGLTDIEFRTFLHQCKKTNLDPLRKQIYAMKFDGRMTTITGIDGFRAIAHRTAQYAGREETRYEYEGDKLKRATVTVYRLVGGVRCPFTASANWTEFYPRDAKKRFMWDKLPEIMLGKTAEAQALRMGFPEEFSGVHADAEMDQAYGANETKATAIKNAIEQAKDVTPETRADDLGEFDITFGQFSGKRLKEIPANDLAEYVERIEKDSARLKKPLAGRQLELVQTIKAFLQYDGGGE